MDRASRLVVRGRELALDPDRPVVMGILNASPESFSDGGHRTVAEQVERGLAMVAAGAAMVDVGGESGVTNRPPISPAEEIGRVVPVVAALVERGLVVSVDTWKAPVARAALEAGAHLINDVSGLRDVDLARHCASFGAGLVVMHTRAAPKVKAFPAYADLVGDIVGFLRQRMAAAAAAGLAPEHVVLDPGPDFAKTPAQTVAALRALPELHALGRPLLLAVSRKDFVGALTGRMPSQRLAGTLAAVGAGLDAGAAIVRVHDVAETVDYLTVRAALRGAPEPPADLVLPERLRREPAAPAVPVPVPAAHRPGPRSRTSRSAPLPSGSWNEEEL